MADMPHVVTSLGDVRTHTRRVAEEITQKFQPIFFVWGNGPSGEHAEGRALDFMNYEYGGGVDSPGPIRLDFGQRIADYLWKHRVRLGVWYVIYNRRIISMTRPEQGWNSYNGSSPHRNHVHVSFYNGVSYDAPATGRDWFDMASQEDLEQAVWHVLSRNVGELVWGWDNVPNTSADTDWTPRSFLSNIEDTQERMQREHRELAEKVDRVLDGLHVLMSQHDGQTGRLDGILSEVKEEGEAK